MSVVCVQVRAGSRLSAKDRLCSQACRVFELEVGERERYRNVGVLVWFVFKSYEAWV